MRNQAGLEGMGRPSHPGRPANAVANKPCTMSPHEGRTRPRDAARKTSHDLDKPRDAKRRHAAVGQLGVKRSPVQIRPARLVEQVFLLASRPTLDYHSHYYCDPHPATAMRGPSPQPYERRSVAVSSNLHPSGFDELMPKTLAGVRQLDRLWHHAHVCVTTGDSVRLQQATTGKGVKPLT